MAALSEKLSSTARASTSQYKGRSIIIGASSRLANRDYLDKLPYIPTITLEHH